MESMLLALLAAAAAFAAGWRLGARRRSAPAPGVPDEERLAWLQRLSTVGQMMSGVLHEVRTPLNTVILTCEHAQRVLERGGDPRPQLETVAREADRAVEILSDILDFAKPSPLQLEPMALAELIGAALEPVRIRFEERAVELTVAVPPDVRVQASARHLHQVLTIVLINSLDAMPFGGKLALWSERYGDTIRLYARDTGVGIEPQVLARLFEPFASSRLETGGTGLGLNVARWIMNKHGGDVSIASPGIGKGTTVTLTLKSA